MDPLYELASRLLQELDPEWGIRSAAQRTTGGLTQWLHERVHDKGETPLSRLIMRFRSLRRGVLHWDITPSDDPDARWDRSDTRWKRVHDALVAEGQAGPGRTSLHRRRIIITRLLYKDPVLAIAATRLVRRYPRYYEELARDITEEWDLHHVELRPALEDSKRRLSGTGVREMGYELSDMADRLVADYQFAVAAADALDIPKPFSHVLFNELEEVRRSRGGGHSMRPGIQPRLHDDRHTRKPLSARKSPIDLAHDEELVGLAISGGGIRSATFSLGVLQALSRLDLLRRFDYLSTVSGGGYIGSWLAAWIRRLHGGTREVQQRLSPDHGPLPTEGDARPIRMLREYSNYLSPSAGLWSADSWTIVTVWLRNTLLNQLVLIAFLATALLVPWFLLVSGADRTTQWVFDTDVPLWSQWILGLTLVVSTGAIASALRDFDDKQLGPGGAPPKALGWSDTGVASVVGGTLLAGTWIASFVIVAITDGHWRLDPRLPLMDRPAFAADWLSRDEWAIAVASAITMLAGLLTVQVAGRYARCLVQEQAQTREQEAVPDVRALVWASLRLAVWTPIPALVGGVLIAISHRLGPFLATHLGRSDALVYQLVVLPPLLMESVAITMILHIGMLGRLLPDDRREWWSRLGAHQLRLAVAWTGVCGIALLVPHWVTGEFDRTKLMSTLTWILTTAGGVMAGRSSHTGDAQTPTIKTRLASLLAHAAPAVFVLGLLVAISILVHRVLDPSSFWQVLLAMIALGSIGLLLSWRVDINEFSMHHFYKNRLVRCYLGASRARRRPNQFTGFDANDDVKLSELHTQAEEPYVGPFPIINSALNLTKGSDLAWQERKAESFVFTPLVCGYEVTENRVVGGRNLRRSGYRPTAKFAYPKGPGLGTAMAISGAAASPNMGYHSSPAVAFLLTVFNVRLGWWVGNTRYSSRGFVSSPWRKSSPGIGALYLLKELLGRTDNRSQYINLSDGGHFENLGVYELVRRRCRYIVAVDAEEDGKITMSGLAGVIRKCLVDFGVRIDIDTANLVPNPNSRAHCSIGRIYYPERPFDGAAESHGWLLYLKSSITGDESTDIREYDAREPSFPHQSTADQWFDETQFESYRRLGYHVANDALSAAANGGQDVDLPDVFRYLSELWSPVGVPADDLRRHIEMYEELYDRAADGTGPVPALMDPVLFPQMTMPPPPLPREALYLPTATIEFMHSIFIDLDLDRFAGRPHHDGWVAIFRTWARSDTVRTAWARVSGSYSNRFRQFMARLQSDG